MSRVLIGRYIPQESPIHQLDPRSKIIFTFGFVIALFQMNCLADYIGVMIFLGSIIYMSRIEMSYFIKSLRPFWWVFALTFLIQLVTVKGGGEIFSVGKFTLYENGVYQAIFLSLRFVYIIFATTLLTLSTTPMEITDGVERLLSPLNKIHVPVHEFAFMLSIALRFIPTLTEEAETILKAQASRGMNFDSGTMLSRIRGMMSVIIPLFINSFKKAEDLAVAMEARGFVVGAKRTKVRVLSWEMKDTLAISTLILVSVILFIT